MHNLFDRVVAISACIATLTLVPIAAAGQALYKRDAPKQPGAPSWERERAKLPPFTPPRTPEGTPNLQGRWGGPDGGDDIEEHEYVDVSSPPEETYISDPPGGRIPYQPWAKAVQAEHRAGLARGWPGETARMYPDPQTFCLYSVPRATYRGGFEIVQVPGYVMILYGFNHFYRFIPTTTSAHGEPARQHGWATRAARGRAIRFVDVTNLNGGTGSIRSEILQRQCACRRAVTLADANTIDYEATITTRSVHQAWTIRCLSAVPSECDRQVRGRDRENACPRERGDRAQPRPRVQVVQGVTPPNSESARRH